MLIAHHGCAYYARRFGQDPDAFLATQLQDLRDAAGLLRHRYLGLRVEIYLAGADSDWVAFCAVAEQ